MSAPPSNVIQPNGREFEIKSYGLTDIGREREVNEDAMLVDNLHSLYLVFDGMGGHTAGQLASQLAMESLAATFVDSEATHPQVEPLVRGIENANQAIFDHAQEYPETRGMGTTAVGVRFDEDQLHICHVGDSRLYRLRGPGLQRLTRDHSLANLYADKPELEGQMGPSTSNVIVRALGLDFNVEVDHRIVAVEEDDLFLLCCDGLTDLVTDKDIGNIMRSELPLSDMASALVDTANHNGGTDNITVILMLACDADGDDGFSSDGKTVLGF
ncbi:MAG: serine/threonine-protein phosphatase [Kofleriaceae bacterium]|nr:serine/threonine-protein phosphatase [Kofleriaceae bacterium]